MSLCAPDAAGMVTAWAVNPGAAFGHDWEQGGPLLTPEITSLGTHIHIWEGGAASSVSIQADLC